MKEFEKVINLLGMLSREYPKWSPELDNIRQAVLCLMTEDIPRDILCACLGECAELFETMLIYMTP